VLPKDHTIPKTSCVRILPYVDHKSNP
jgi:hypothetical protein